MDPFLARTMVECLSKGINPRTGRALSSGDACNSELVQEAILEVLEHCTIESNEQFLARQKEEKEENRQIRKEETARRYPRAGEAWSKKEEEKLLILHRKGYNIYRIANTLKRTPGAISDRLKKMQERPIYRTKGTSNHLEAFLLEK